jgi:hypothetical protein
VGVHETGEHGATGEIERGLARGGIDVAAAARERHLAVTDDEALHDGAGGVHRVDAAVRQQHGVSGGEARLAWIIHER